MRVSNDGTQYKGALVDIDNTLEAKQGYVGGLIQRRNGKRDFGTDWNKQ